jgi:hypothetical protein
MRIGRIVLACATVLGVVLWLRTQPRPPAPDLRGGWPFLLLALVSVVPALAFRAVKWNLTMRPVLPGVSVRGALRSYVGAIPYALITPGRVGELARLLYLPRCPRGVLQGAALVFMDKVMDLAALLWWAVGGIYLVLGIWPAFLVGLAAAVVSGFPRWSRSFGGFWKWLSRRLGREARWTGEPVLGGGYGVKLTLFILLFGVLGFAVEWFQVWCLVRAWSGAGTEMGIVASVMSLVTLVNALQLTSFGLGIREGLAGYWLSKYGGVAPLSGAACAFALFLIDQAAPAAAGLFIRTRREEEALACTASEGSGRDAAEKT